MLIHWLTAWALHVLNDNSILASAIISVDGGISYDKAVFKFTSTASLDLFFGDGGIALAGKATNGTVVTN